MDTVPKVSAKKNPGLQDDHDPTDIGQRAANKRKEQQSHMGEKKGQKSTHARKQKPDTSPDADSLGGGSQGGM
jgi:hypothetical protein